MSREHDPSTRRPVVAGVDFSTIGELALEHALELAAEDPSVEPHFIHVASSYGPLVRIEIGDASRALSVEQANALLRRHVEAHVRELSSRRPVEFPRAVSHVRIGSPADEICQLALDLNADLVVVGTHGRRGLRRMLLGSVAEAVIRLAPCPVYVVRPREPRREQSAATPLLPPCERCLEVRRATLGQRLWCEQHSSRPTAEVWVNRPS